MTERDICDPVTALLGIGLTVAAILALASLVWALSGCVQIYFPQGCGGTNETASAEYRMAQVSVGVISTSVSSYDKVTVSVNSNSIPVLSGNTLETNR